MKKTQKLVGSGVLACVIGLASTAASADCTANLTADRELNVRSGPSTNYQPVGRIPGAACGIRIGRCDDGWCRVDYQRITGFASAFYLDRTEEAGPIPKRRVRERGLPEWAGIARDVFDRLARQRDWTQLGTLRVSAERDRDVIQMDGQDGRFDALRMRVRGSAVDFRRIIVVYGNGVRHNLDFDRVVKRGAETGELPLRGNQGRFIDRIIFVYKSAARRGPPAEVQVWARQTQPGQAGARERNVERFGRGWTRLGEAQVDRGRDRDVIEVGLREGRYDAVGLVATKNDIRVRKMLVRYGNGVEHEVDVSRRLRDGDRSDPIELRGRAGRGIDRVTLFYGTVSRGPRANVELWGREEKSRN